ncbi:MAG: FHA domain-containing protein [Actinomycetota bacterium]|nr:FHA domain-containing protein [Actinomycetota bacterium]
MAELYCNNCGHRNPAGSNFCSSCGGPLEPEAADDHTTMTFQLEPPGDGEEASVDLDEMAADGVMVVKRGPNAGSSFSLDKALITAGRHPDSDIFLDDITVSRRHVEISRASNGYRVRDVGSLNGTYLNRERIDEAALANGDEVQVGKFKLIFFSAPTADRRR